jgi:putative phosphoribosyl transferase
MKERNTREVIIPGGRVSLEGTLALPSEASSVVVFAHGSGSSRLSPRNKFVANALNEHGFGTLLFDLMTAEEEQIDMASMGNLRFDVGFLAERLVAATAWLVQNEETRRVRVGYFGASTGAAAALIAAAELPRIVNAVVSRGGRPDLAASALEHVQAPTLLIVGEEDKQVIELNRLALAQLKSQKLLALVPGATHLFEEPGTLETVASLAVRWFADHLIWGSEPKTSTAS